jgi:hypothetical protein
MAKRLSSKKSTGLHPALSPVSPRYIRDRWDAFLTQDKTGMLYIDGVSAEKIAQKYGTPGGRQQ